MKNYPDSARLQNQLCGFQAAMQASAGLREVFLLP